MQRTRERVAVHSNYDSYNYYSTTPPADTTIRTYLPVLVAVPGDHELAHALMGVSQQRSTEHLALRSKCHVAAHALLPCLRMERVAGARPWISARRAIRVGGVGDS